MTYRAPSLPVARGAPGVHVVAPEPVREITGVRRDVAAFVGVAPRGPAREPAGPLEPDADVGLRLAGQRSRSVAVAVSSWDEYRFHFGGFAGPGRLPYAVSAFFAQGGERAWVVRIVHDYGDARDAGGRAGGRLGTLLATTGDPLTLHARTEGSWGNALRAALTFRLRPLPVLSATLTELVVDADRDVPAGSAVRVRLPGDVLALRYVDRSVVQPRPSGPGELRHLLLDQPLTDQPATVDVVTATLTLTDDDPTLPRREVFPDAGLRADHPRWLARVLAEGSTLAEPDPAWAGSGLDLGALPDATLPAVDLVDATGAPRMSGGADRWADVVPEDFDDPGWVPGEETPGAGVYCLVENDEVGLLVAPDLYDPAPLAAQDDVTDPPSLAGPDFDLCVDTGPPPEPPPPPPPGLDGLALDPLLPADLDRIVANQQALVRFAERRAELTVLLDVPLGLPHRRVLAWRDAFDSPYAAAYHPWLDVAAPDDARDSLARVNPSAFAAGIVAARERRLGVQHGPSNEIAVGAVRVHLPVSPEQHDELHPAGINVFRAERDGVRLTAARTLARRPELRQLNVARIMTVLRLSLEREMDWAAFEPNGEALWGEVRRMVHAFLTRLYDAGAFTGGTTKEAFFVRCDRTTMTRNDLDQGRFVCLVGVAPAEPVEFLVLQLARERDSSVRVEAAPGRLAPA